MEETDSVATLLTIRDRSNNNQPASYNETSWNRVLRGMFEQLARYTMRYQESDLHLGLYSSLTSANNLNLPTLLTLFYFSTLLYLLVQV